MMISCLGSNDDYTDTIVYKDAQISSFTASHDSIDGLSSLKFTIDQIGGYIYNKDSLPYGTDVSMVVCTLSYVTGVAGIQVTPEATPDSTFWWNGTDSLDFSKPVKFVTTAYDGLTTKTYIAKINVHTLIPDSMVWELYSDIMIGKTVDEQKVIQATYDGQDTYFMYVRTGDTYQLYYSPVTDGKTWAELPLAGLSGDMLLSQATKYGNSYYMPSANDGMYASQDGITWSRAAGVTVRYILGTIEEGRQPSGLVTITPAGDKLRFAVMDEKEDWKLGDEVPAGFPVTGFGNISYSNMYSQYLEVVAGRNSNGELLNQAWSTMDGLTWTQMTDDRRSDFEKKEGVMLSMYDNKFCLAGGINEEGEGSKEIHFSSDFGVTWHKTDSLTVFPEEYPGRGFSSVIIDKDNYMLLFGGKTSKDAPLLDEIWRGRINRLGFKD